MTREAKTIKDKARFYNDTAAFINAVIGYLTQCPDEAPTLEFLQERQRTICKDLRLHLGVTKKEVYYSENNGY